MGLVQRELKCELSSQNEQVGTDSYSNTGRNGFKVEQADYTDQL